VACHNRASYITPRGFSPRSPLDALSRLPSASLDQLTSGSLYRKVDGAMDLSRALGQLAHINQKMPKGEIYRGYRSVPVAASGLIGFVAAGVQAPALGVNDPVGFVFYWTAIGCCAALVGAGGMIFH